MRGKPDPRAFIALAGVVSAATVVGLLPAWARTPHHAALPPLGLFADIRVLLAQAPS